MTDDARPPNHNDIALALAATVATLRNDFDALQVLSSRWQTSADLDAFVMGLLSSFATYVAAKQDDPESYLLSWIAVEQSRHDAAQDDPPQG